jgi:hypothetical protein
MPNVAIGILSSDAACHAANNRPTIAEKHKGKKKNIYFFSHVSTSFFFFFFFGEILNVFLTAGDNETKRNARLHSDPRRLSERGGERTLCSEKKREKIIFFSTQKKIIFLSLSLSRESIVRTWPVTAKRHQPLVSLPAAAAAVVALPVVVCAAVAVVVALASTTTAC